MPNGAPVKQEDIDKIPRLGHIYWHWIGGVEHTTKDVAISAAERSRPH